MCSKYGNQLIKIFLNVKNLYIYISEDDAVNTFAAKPIPGILRDSGLMTILFFFVFFLKPKSLEMFET